MPSLTGKPPFATDEPDSFYESAPQPQRRLRQPPPPDPNERTSAYNLYDNYLGDETDEPQVQVQPSLAERNSDVGALGMGLLNLGDSDSEDDDDDIQHMPNCPPGLSGGSKHAVLAAATASPIRSNFPPVQRQQQSQPQQLPMSQASSSQPQARSPVMSQTPQVSGPLLPTLQSRPHQPHLDAPRPAYPAPVLVRRGPGATPVGQRDINPFEPRYASPAPSTPHPLHPAVSPITPAFIRPSTPRDESSINVKFSEVNTAVPRKAIIRGDTEETLLPRRGEKGDDFWRRFSMVAKDGNERKESSWLHKTRSGSMRHARVVWFTAILVLSLIAAGVVLGLVLRRNVPAHQQPVALGGSADSLATSSSSVVSTIHAQPSQPSQTSLHVSPTLTLGD